MERDHTCHTDCPLGVAIPVTEAAPDYGIAGTMGRRVFLSRAMLAAAAAALAACGASDAIGPSFSGTATLDVTDYPSLASVGGVALVMLNGAPLAVVRTGTASFAALSRVCPHEGGNIVQSGSGFTCTKHGATFDKNGAWTGGQRTTSMRSYATSYDSATGILTVG